MIRKISQMMTCVSIKYYYTGNITSVENAETQKSRKNIQVAWSAYKDRGKKGIEEIKS